MTKTFSLVALAALIAFAAPQARADGDLISKLSADEQTAVRNGEQVVHLQDVDGSVWPSVVVYQAVNATPEQVAAVMFDYPLHQTMFSKEVSPGRREGVIKSVPAHPGAITTDIDYTMNFPKVMGISLPDEDYTVTDTLAPMGADGYQITWTFVKATSMKDCSGSSKFEKLDGGTLVEYTNFINPPRPSLAKLIKKMAIQRVQDTVKELANQATAELSAGDRSQLNAQLTSLHHALGQ